MSAVILLTTVFTVILTALFFQLRFGAYFDDVLKDIRLTVIESGGEVVYDNVKDGITENHADRPEIISAFESGYGDSSRRSDTTGNVTHYYAMSMSDEHVVRVALTEENISEWLYSFLPHLLWAGVLVAVAVIYFGTKLTNMLVRPINDIDLENISAMPYDELSPFARRIGEQKDEIRQRLTESQNKSETINAIVSNMPEGFILVDKDGTVLLCNDLAEGIWGTSSAVGRNILEMTRNWEFIEKARLCMSGTHTEMTLEGSRTYTVYFSPSRNTEQEVGGAIIFFLDVTEKILADKQRVEFSANVSHELKTPLTTIYGLSEMMSNSMVKKEDMEEFAGKIYNQSGRLLTLIDDIIRLSQFDEGGIEKTLEEFDLYCTMRSVADSLLQFAKDKQVTVTAPDGKLNISANRSMIEELLFNLTENAIKYNKAGGSVEMNAEQDGSTVKITVRDTGIGVEAEDIANIFKRFYRVDKSRSKQTGGTGLGLSIVKHIAEQHGGTVKAESVPNEGTTIIATINSPCVGNRA